MRGKVLLGWLTQDDAVRYLREDCVFDPPLTEQEAEELWREKKASVDALPPRVISNPSHIPLTARERDAANLFLAALRQIPGNAVLDVVKVDPRGLVAHQFDINLDRAHEYSSDPDDAEWCIRNCLPGPRPAAQLPTTFGAGWWNFGLPHGEFLLVFNGQAFGIVQGLPHVSVSALGDRTLLWTGYHRSYGRVSMVSPDASERTVLAALTSEGNVAFGPGSTNPALRDVVLGVRPPLLADFFDERFFIEVELRRKRYELRVEARLNKINAD